MFTYLRAVHGQSRHYRTYFPLPMRLYEGRWHLVVGSFSAPWLNGVLTTLYYVVLTRRGLRRVTFLY